MDNGGGEGDYASDWTDDLTSDAHMAALLTKARIGMEKLAKQAKKKHNRQVGKGKGRAIDQSDDESTDGDEDRDAQLDFMVFDDEKEDDIKLPPLLADGLPPLYVEWKDGQLQVRNLDAEDALKAVDGPRKRPELPHQTLSSSNRNEDILSSDEEDQTDNEAGPPIGSSSRLTLDIVPPLPPTPAYEIDDKGKRVTKKEKKERKAATAGALWYDLPQATPEVLRAAEALRLRNSLDPKRYYRKEDTKSQQKYIALGRILPSNSPFGQASADNLPRAARKRTIVDELVDDAEAKRYAKKKFTELSATRGARGRGTAQRRQQQRQSKW